MSKTKFYASTAPAPFSVTPEGIREVPAASGAHLNTNVLPSMGLDPFLRIEAVTSVIGLSVPTVYRLMAKGDFPRPIKLTSSARGWKLSDIIAWMQSRAAAGGQSGERA
jgi:prophage regulatory protein